MRNLNTVLVTCLMFGGVMASNSETADQKLIEKGFDQKWIDSLTEKGKPEVWSGDQLKYIGMPIGGLFAGQVYLGGDGRLWYWDIQNTRHISPGGPGDKFYKNPLKPTENQVIEQEFYLKLGGRKRALNSDGFDKNEIKFRGEYPIGKVNYSSDKLPVAIDLLAYSPFVPTDSEKSGIPIVLMEFTVKNNSSKVQKLTIGGSLQNMICNFSSGNSVAKIRNRTVNDESSTSLICDAFSNKAQEKNRPDIIFDDFEHGEYTNWKAEGKAFGNKPFIRTDFAKYHNVTNHEGTVLVNSHNTRVAHNNKDCDALTGKLTSEVFTIKRNYISFLISGGSHKDKTCVNLIIDGNRVGSVTGPNSNQMRISGFDVTKYQGKKARLEVVDTATGGWGHIGIDSIVFTDVMKNHLPLDQLADYGSMQLTVFTEGKGAAAVNSDKTEVVAPIKSGIVGNVETEFELMPGKEKTITFAIAWSFPNINNSHGALKALKEMPVQSNYYNKFFKTASDVIDHWKKNGKELREATMIWNRAWNDATLPQWFLDRTFLNVSTLATTVWHRFHNPKNKDLDGRPYCWEGVYLGDGTCTHVLHYEQAMGRIFPDVSRDLRRITDYNIAFKPNGVIGYRAEFGYGHHYGTGHAIDGHAGTVLRTYREHTTAPNNDFLKVIWPRVKKSIQVMIEQDKAKTGKADGILEGQQYNTLDRTWYGKISWISVLYSAAVRAGEEMALDMGDKDFAKVCKEVADLAYRNIPIELFNGEYFQQIIDPENLYAPNTNKGSHLDQLLGESTARQLNLPNIVPPKLSRKALESIFNYNFVRDFGAYLDTATVKPSRFYSERGEAGTIMCSFPKGGAEIAPGNVRNSWEKLSVGYFTEFWTGQEHHTASHMIAEGMVTEGLALVKAVHDRYTPEKRNPFNEIEYGNHYSRAMSGYAPFVSMTGFQYHGPKGIIGFSPKINADNFKSAFIAGESWGSFTQKRQNGVQKNRIEVKYGTLKLNELVLEIADNCKGDVTVKIGQRSPLYKTIRDGNRVHIKFIKTVKLSPKQKIIIEIK